MHNVKTVVDGYKFDSKKEAARWSVLRDAARVGKISQLKRQVTYKFKFVEVTSPKMILNYRYIADFTYVKDGNLIVEDVKSPYTAKLPVYKRKKKWMKVVHKIDIKEVYNVLESP